MSTRWSDRVRVAGVALIATLVLGACESLVAYQVNQVRSAAGRPTLAVSEVLSGAARAHAHAMCEAGAVSPSPNAGEEYDQESHGGVYELVGSAPLRPEVPAGNRNATATDEIWRTWRNDPQLIAARWDDMGVGEAECADGRLYLTAVLRDALSMAPNGLYSTPQYDVASLTEIKNLQYGHAVNEQGVDQSLLLDVYLPPGSTPTQRPTVVLIHGGAFVGGDKADMAGEARAWAVRGYVAVATNYRLASVAFINAGGQLAAAANGIDDTMEAVRWVKANAVTYRINPDRIGAIGWSAGGALSLGVALLDDATPTGPLAAYTPSVAAGISTGAHLTPGIDAGLVHVSADAAPILMFHYETDEATHDSAAYAFRTCSANRDAGNPCDFVTQPGVGHTAWLTPGAQWWASETGPFMARWLLHG